ncbi:MAG: hypothetical protein AAGA60_23915 [Cyanobacteria bacterium P01_E01_bin.42]
MNTLRTTLIAIFFSLAFLLSSANAYATAEVPGCREAWNSMVAVRQIGNLATLVKNDCSILHRQGLRLPKNGGTKNIKLCAPAWNGLIKSGQSKELKFLVSRNCPVLCRKGWEECK